MYAKARAGELSNFTGIDSPYEPPQSPEIRLSTEARPASELADELVDQIIG
ncbi:adenylyl-sulfate kinase [Oleiagrimonas sp. C23AA]|uniref:adenylyl-sulfate kinase n=1 Tax=Oleiagrimonas sp. C23AA TaxID=2719047 RepID=UPI0023F95EB7|nr:adenylyl-sulfate kinase [Oleiagrimonas sp. C23AA]